MLMLMLPHRACYGKKSFVNLCMDLSLPDVIILTPNKLLCSMRLMILELLIGIKFCCSVYE